MPAEESEYKGQPTLILTLNDRDRYALILGLKKARMVIQEIDAIIEFYTKYKGDMAV